LWGNNVVLRIKLPVTRKNSTLFLPATARDFLKKNTKSFPDRIYWEAFVVLALPYGTLIFLISS